MYDFRGWRVRVSDRAFTLFVVFAATVLSSCETTPKVDSEPSTIASRSIGASVIRPAITAQNNINVVTPPAIRPGKPPSQVGAIPELTQGVRRPRRPLGVGPKLAVTSIDAFVPAMPLPDFIDVVFGEMLKAPYVTGPDVASRTEVIQLRSSGIIDAPDFLSLIESSLETYGVRIVPENGVYNIVDDKSLRSQIPDFIRSRANLRTRPDLRPVVQFVQMRAVDANSMLTIVREAFGNDSERLRIEANPLTDTLSLTGLPSDVDAALSIINQLDELEFAGSEVLRYSPRYWDVTALSTELSRALGLEGWQVSVNPRETRAISLLPVEFSNDLFVFTRLPEARRRVSQWLEELDSVTDRGDVERLFIYQVKNVDAELLAGIANKALGGETGLSVLLTADEASNPATQGRDDGRSSGRVASTGVSQQGPFTVDSLGNRLIFTGSAIEYERVLEFLETLDTPAPEVLIEVQIAEVTLTDDLNYGVEIFDGDILKGNGQLGVSTDGLGLGTAGLNVRLLSGDVDAALNALATNRQVKVLSTPVLVARSGGQAEIQVGQDVPVISSQRAAESQDGIGNIDILQTVQYRATGVLLSIEPIVFSNSRIDLTISQEVSSTVDTANSGISSPTISNRSLTTQLSLQDGETAVLGGLIQENIVRNETGVPLLKDLPVIGGVFSNSTFSRDRTELVVLITAYVLRGQIDKSQFAKALSSRIDQSFNDQSKLTTLNPIKM